MKEKVKLALRVSTGHFDEEINDLIDSAKQDLQLSGVKEEKINNPDSLITRAITTYCKAHFGYDNPEADRFAHSYYMLKQHLTLSQEYMDGDENEA